MTLPRRNSPDKHVLFGVEVDKVDLDRGVVVGCDPHDVTILPL